MYEEDFCFRGTCVIHTLFWKFSFRRSGNVPIFPENHGVVYTVHIIQTITFTLYVSVSTQCALMPAVKKHAYSDKIKYHHYLLGSSITEKTQNWLVTAATRAA